MIENFRKVAKNPIMKTLLFVLVVSFMLSGLSAGFLSQIQGDNYIVEVAGEKIYPTQVEGEYKNIANSFAERGMNIDDKMLADMGVTQEKILNDLVQRKLILAEADSMGLTVSNDFLRKEIIKHPAFTTDGKFSSDAFKRFLYTRGLREHQYLDEMRKEIAANIMMAALLGDIKTPDRIFDLLKNREATRYDIEAVIIPHEQVALDKEPSDEDLKTFLFTNSATFEVEENRDVSYVEIKKLKDEKSSHEMAVGMEDDLAGGATIEEIAKKQSVQIQKTSVSKSEAGDIAALAFALNEGELSEVKETDKDTYLVVQLNKITEKHVPELDEIKDKVRNEWTLTEKQKLSKQLAIKIYDDSVKEGKFSAGANGLDKKNFNKLSADDVVNKEGLLKIRGSSIADAKQGQIFGLYDSPVTHKGFVITRLAAKSIPELSEDEIANYKNVFGHTYANELEQSYLNYLAAKHGVEFNSKYEKKQ